MPAARQIVTLSLGEGLQVSFCVGDLTQEDTDAIVNAANSSLMGGGGVDGAIHRAGGPAILEQCKKIVAEHGRLAPGHAVHTTGGKLKARYVIHTVGPIWHGGKDDEPSTLANCYRESIRVADKLQLRTIAFPSISTGAYGYPVRLAADVAIRAVIHELPLAQHVRHVRFVLFDEDTQSTYISVLDSIVASSPEGHSYRINRLKNSPETLQAQERDHET